MFFHRTTYAKNEAFNAFHAFVYTNQHKNAENQVTPIAAEVQLLAMVAIEVQLFIFTFFKIPFDFLFVFLQEPK